MKISEMNDNKIRKCVNDANIFAETGMTENQLKILQNPKLFDLITETELDKKIVGELNSRKVIFLCACGRLVENSNLASYNLMVNSQSGSGKDWVSSKTLDIIPKENCVKRTRISENVFTYWHNPRFEPNWTWDGKVFCCEDISNRVLNSDVFKVMCSSGSKATVLVNQTPIDIEIKGKPVVVITIANAFLSAEISRRFNLIDLDETIDQTKAIMKRQAELAENGILLEYDPEIIEAQKFLKRIKVKVPFAGKLLENFPTDHLIMRTHFDRFLDYIKASTALHQYQREQDENGFYSSTGQDYDIARIALLKTTSNPLMVPLTKNQKRILNVFRKLNSGTLMVKKFSISELEPKITFIGQRTLYRELDKLAESGFLEKNKEDIEGSRKAVMVYSLIETGNIKIPTWDELQQKVVAK